MTLRLEPILIAVALAAPIVLASPAMAQPANDGTWRGTARCAGVNGDTLTTPVTMTINGPAVRFMRIVPTPDGRATAGIESGTGSAAENGALKIQAAAQGPNGPAKASYTGRIAGDAVTLRGGPGGKPTCAIEARKS